MDKIQQRSLSYGKSTELLQKIKAQPVYCECARIGSRALADGNMPVMRYLTNISDFFDKKNIQLEHQHIIFAQSKDNVGLMGQDGVAELFQEDLSTLTYHFDNSECFDGSILREAIEKSGIPKAYAWLGFNCQAYVQEIKKKYQEIRDNIGAAICTSAN